MDRIFGISRNFPGFFLHNRWNQRKKQSIYCFFSRYYFFEGTLLRKCLWFIKTGPLLDGIREARSPTFPTRSRWILPADLIPLSKQLRSVCGLRFCIMGRWRWEKQEYCKRSRSERQKGWRGRWEFHTSFGQSFVPSSSAKCPKGEAVDPERARCGRCFCSVAHSQKLNVKASVIQDYESGKVIPNPALISKMEKVLGVRLRDPKK